MNSMYLALGYNCNHNCFFCPCVGKDDMVKEADLEQIIFAIDSGINDKNIKYITLSGGEPTLHKNFHQILEYCVSKKINTTILSNGDTLHKVENIHKYFDGINTEYFSVTTAIHSINTEVHDKVTGRNGSHYRTVSGLKNLIPMHISFTVKQVISKWNYKELPEFINFIFSEYGSFASITLCGMDFCGMNEDKIDEVGIGYREIGSYLEKALDNVLFIRKQFGGFPQVTVADLPLCSVDPYYWGFFAKVSRGMLSKYSAPTKSNGNLFSCDGVVNDCDVYFRECKSCCVSNFCPGVWNSAYNYFGDNAVKAYK